jgi:hypothetical protein
VVQLGRRGYAFWGGRGQGNQKRLRLVLINSPCTSGSNFDLLLCKCGQPGKGFAQASCHLTLPAWNCVPATSLPRLRWPLSILNLVYVLGVW